MKILCEAISFGFGPVSKLLSLCELLSQRHVVDFIGAGCSLSLATRSEIFDRIIQAETATSTGTMGNVTFADYDLVISVMNPQFARIALSQKAKLVIVDSLFYMWDRIDPVWEQCDLLVIQSFSGEKERLESMSCNLPNAYLVGPIVSPKIIACSSKQNHNLIINFGGADYPFVKSFDKIASFIRQLVTPLDNMTSFENKIVSIGPRCAKSLQNLNSFGFHVNTFSHDAFLNELSQAQLLLTIPGLTTAFEAFHMGIPTFFLPPLNYSQFHNLRKFRSLDAAKGGVHWDDLYPTLSNQQLPEEEGVQLIESLIGRTLKTPELMSEIINQYVWLLNNWRSMEDISLHQRRLYDSIGGCGTYQAVALIEKVLSDK